MADLLVFPSGDRKQGLSQGIGRALLESGKMMAAVRGLPDFVKQQIIYDITEFAWDYTKKFSDGYREHGTNLDKIDPGRLNEMQGEEQIDEWAYRMSQTRQARGEGFTSD